MILPRPVQRIRIFNNPGRVSLLLPRPFFRSALAATVSQQEIFYAAMPDVMHPRQPTARACPHGFATHMICAACQSPVLPQERLRRRQVAVLSRVQHLLPERVLRKRDRQQPTVSQAVLCQGDASADAPRAAD